MVFPSFECLRSKKSSGFYDIIGSDPNEQLRRWHFFFLKIRSTPKALKNIYAGFLQFLR